MTSSARLTLGSSRSLRNWAKPRRSACRYRSVAAAVRPGSGTSARTSTIATAKEAASSHTAPTGPSRAMASPASDAPMSSEVREMPSYADVIRMYGMEPASSNGLSRLAFDRSPIARTAPATATSATSRPKSTRPTNATSPTATALAPSAMTDVRQLPSRSCHGADSTPLSTYGSISAPPTTPIFTGLCVVTRTNQGMAKNDIRLPIAEIASAINSIATPTLYMILRGRLPPGYRRCNPTLRLPTMNGVRQRQLLLALVALVTIGSTILVATASTAKPPVPEAWVGTWAAAPAPAPLASPIVDPFSVNGFHDQTIRIVVHTALGGDRARVRLTNRFGAKPLTIGHATLALPWPDAGAGDLRPNSIHELMFNGQKAVTIPPGGAVFSDVAAMDVPPTQDIAISVFLPGETG